MNTARGECVDTDALAAALQGGALAGAALDVMSPEPPPEPPLVALTNAVLTPHTAFLSERSVAALRAAPFTAVAEALAGRRPSFIVNADVLSRQLPSRSVIMSAVCELGSVIRPVVAGLLFHPPGRSLEEVIRAYGVEAERVVKLGSNENPYGPSPHVLEAIRCEVAPINTYPAGLYQPLKARIAELNGV